MKKLLGIVFLSLLWCNVVFAGCRDDIEYSVSYDDAFEEFGKEKTAIFFVFKNKSEKEIELSNIRLISKDGHTMRKYKYEIDGDQFDAETLRPYAISEPFFSIKGLNLDVAKSTGYECKYVTKSEPKIKKNKSGSSGAKGFLKKLLGNN